MRRKKTSRFTKNKNTLNTDNDYGVLNPQLYKRLLTRYKDVLISQQGEMPILDPLDGKVVAAGEKYRVNCPFCGDDDDHHLWISPLWGIPDGEGGFHWSWAICYRRNCLGFEEDRSGQNFERLRTEVYDWNRNTRGSKIHDRMQDTHLVVTEFDERNTGPVDYPGYCIPLLELEEGHQARSYLRDRRGFDLQEIAELWDPRYCITASMEYPGVVNRLVIPAYQGGQMLTWQARIMEDDSHRPKYYNLPGAGKTRVLYGIDNAKVADFPFAVVVEGVTDVWRMGPGACACLGKSPSPAQSQLIVDNWGSQTGKGVLFVFADDEKAWDQSQGSYRYLQQLDPGMKILPVMDREGRDPGDLSREQAWSTVFDAAAEHGIPI